MSPWHRLVKDPVLYRLSNLKKHTATSNLKPQVKLLVLLLRWLSVVCCLCSGLAFTLINFVSLLFASHFVHCVVVCRHFLVSFCVFGENL